MEKVRSGLRTCRCCFSSCSKGVGRVQFVQHVAVDIDQVAAIGAPRHQMGLPDLVEQGLGHDGFGQ